MIENNEIKINVIPLIVLFLINTLNSLWSVDVILIHKKFHRDGINQNIDGISIIPNTVLNQFKEIPDLVDGSNDENKFVIIFNLIYIFFF